MKRKDIATVAAVAAVLVMAVAVAFSGVETVATFWALVPPIVAIGLALITKEVYSSLFVGITVGGILASAGSFSAAVDHIVSDGIITAIQDTAGIFLFLVILGVIVALVNKSGGSAAFGRWAERNIKTRVGAQLATFVLGVLIFIDDYFNCLTVGSVMQPVTDSHKISRAKLSYLIDATAAPVCMIAPISSWAAAVSSYAEIPGMSGIEIFVRAIPYNFYSLLTFVFIIAMVVMKADYGPMALHERNAMEKGDLFSTDERVDGSGAPGGDSGDYLRGRPHLHWRLLRRGRLGWYRLRRRLHRRFRQHRCCYGSALGRDDRVGCDHHLHDGPEACDLQGGHGVRTAGLHCHGARHHDPDYGRLSEKHL